MMPLSSGTEPSSLPSDRKPMMPSLYKQRDGEYGTAWSLGRYSSKWGGTQGGGGDALA